MLQHAVSAIPELALVSTMDEFSLAVSRHMRNYLLNYETYTALLINACIRYDQFCKSKNFSKTRNVHHTEIDPYMDTTISDMDISADALDGSPNGGIDLSPQDYLQINTASRPSQPQSSGPGSSSRPNAPSCKLCYDGPIYLPPELYSLISDEVKVKLKKYHDAAIPCYATGGKKPSPRQVNLHETTMNNDDDPPLQVPEVTMDDSAAKTDLDNSGDDNLDFSDSQIYSLIQLYQAQFRFNKSCIYNISAAKGSNFGSLVDRGANGDLAGGDVRILSRSGYKVTVTGIGD